MKKVDEILTEIDQRIKQPFVTPKFGDNWKEWAKSNLALNDLLDIAWMQGRRALLLEEALKIQEYEQEKPKEK